MGIITSLLGIVCILYYIAGVRYAGYRVSGLWIWLAAGIGLMVWGGCRIGCAVAGVPFFVPGALVAIVRVCQTAKTERAGRITENLSCRDRDFCKMER